MDSSIPDFSKPFDRANVTFVFDDGKQLYFNRGTLAFFSPVFDRMLLGDWKEGSDKTVPLPLKSFDDFHTVLRLIALHDEELIMDDNVTTLLSLADEYEMRNILVYCSNYILKHWQIGQKRFEALELAFEFDLRNVTASLLPAIVGSSLADLKVGAEVLSAKVYAAVMQLRVVRQNELAKSGFTLNCYPNCVVSPTQPFVCYWCRHKDRNCASGRCATYRLRPSMCRLCEAGDSLKFCKSCRRKWSGDEGICICGVNCNVWLADDVVKMLLKKKN